MAVESAADRAAMLADFGVAAVVGGTALTGIFDDGYVVVAVDGEAGVTALAPQLLCRSADLAGVAVGDDAVIGDETMTVVDVQPDGTGLTRLILERG